MARVKALRAIDLDILKRTLGAIRQIEAAGGVATVSALARHLGVNRPTVRERLKKYRRWGYLPPTPGAVAANVGASDEADLADRLAAVRDATRRLGRRPSGDELQSILGDQS